MKKTLLLALLVGCIACTEGHAASSPPPLLVALVAGSTSAGGVKGMYINDSSTATTVKATPGLLYSAQMQGGTPGYVLIFCEPIAAVVLGLTTPDYVLRAGPGGSSPLPEATWLPGLCGGGTGISVAGWQNPTGSDAGTSVAVPISLSYQ